MPQQTKQAEKKDSEGNITDMGFRNHEMGETHDFATMHATLSMNKHDLEGVSSN